MGLDDVSSKCCKTIIMYVCMSNYDVLDYWFRINKFRLCGITGRKELPVAHYDFIS